MCIRDRAQKWRPLCEHGIYPFSDGNVLDFDPIFQELIEMSGDSSDILFRPDDYASAFFPAAEQLVKSAEKSEEEGDIEKARDLYLSCLLYTSFAIRDACGVCDEADMQAIQCCTRAMPK